MNKFIVGIFLILLSHSSYAEVYKWIDENGQTRFSDKAPTQNKFETVNIAPSPKTNNIPTVTDQERLEKQKKMLQVFEEDRQLKQAKQAAHLAEEREKWRATCAKQQSIMSTVRTGTLAKYDQNGNKIVLPESDRANIEKQVQQTLSTQCK